MERNGKRGRERRKEGKRGKKREIGGKRDGKTVRGVERAVEKGKEIVGDRKKGK